MTHVYLDASALVKRFRQETGSEVVNDTVDRVSSHDPRRLVVSSLTALETISILNRRRNEVQIPLPEFLRSLRGIIREIRTFSPYLGIDDRLILTSVTHVIKHNVNSADAIHLAVLLSLRDALQQSDDKIVCLAADRRLVRAVWAEGIAAIDPEQDSVTRARAVIL